MNGEPNVRHARVLRILADVAEKGDVSACFANALLLASYHDGSCIEEAERLAREAARLANVPVDGWHTGEPPKDAEVLVTTMDGHVCSSIFAGDSYLIGGSTWGTRSILAWRPRPEPYRPEETTR